MIARRTPAKQSSGDNALKLAEAAVARADKLSPGNPNNSRISLEKRNPAPTDTFADDFKKGNLYAGHMRDQKGGSVIFSNPNNSAEYFAHELGHHITDRTDVGHFVRSLRNNPKLAIALGASGGFLGLPMIQSALQEGDDDIASGIAIASLANAPILVDEALATKNGLAVMKDAGMPATMGQRGRLAGGYLSYASIPIMSALMGTSLGNFADDYTALYDL